MTLDSFQGPFDLLLHLIRTLEVDIFDIPIAQITEQYLSYIHAMEEIELDRVGDYLVMAATLLEIKSRMLLPIEPTLEEEGEEYFDPRDELVQQLLLYQHFQDIAFELQSYRDQRSMSYGRPPTDLTAYQEFIPLKVDAYTLNDLANAMQQAMERFEERQPLERQIYHESLTVNDQIRRIQQHFESLQPNESIQFDEILTSRSSHEIIMTFLAMLELVKKSYISFIQINNHSPIEMVKLKELMPHEA